MKKIKLNGTIHPYLERLAEVVDGEDSFAGLDQLFGQEYAERQLTGLAVVHLADPTLVQLTQVVFRLGGEYRNLGTKISS